MSTGTLLPVARWTALDADGNPIPGAKLHVYASGGSTPANTYSDVALTTPNSQPVIASSSGVFPPLYVPTTSSFKVVLNDADDVLVWTQDNISAIPGLTTTPPFDNTAADLRLTLTSNLPVTTSDVTAATTVYVTPYCGNRLAVYSGSEWNLRSVVETGIAVPNVANTLYDVFAYDNSGTLGFEVLAWTNDTTRATALVFQDGILVKSGATTRRYLGTFRTTAVAGQTEDSGGFTSATPKRYLSNYFHRVPRPVRRIETTASWTYTLATTRQANNNMANQVDVVIGYPDALLDLCLIGMSANSTGGIATQVTIGEDSASVFSTEQVFFAVQTGAGAAANQVLHAYLKKYPAIGRHYYTWQEYSAATGTTTWLGSTYYTGMSGYVMG